MSVGGITFPLEQQSKDPQTVVYSGMYDTEGVTHTKSGERQPVQINMQVMNNTISELSQCTLQIPDFSNIIWCFLSMCYNFLKCFVYLYLSSQT